MTHRMHYIFVVDPWRPDTPHSQYAKEREDTIIRPFKLIPSTLLTFAVEERA